MPGVQKPGSQPEKYAWPLILANLLLRGWDTEDISASRWLGRDWGYPGRSLLGKEGEAQAGGYHPPSPASAHLISTNPA